MKREEYIICERCETRFDPTREMKLGFSSFRCPSCGQEHDASDAQLGEIVYEGEEDGDLDGDTGRPEWDWRTEAVYVISSESGPLKIGVSQKPERRKRSLQTGHPHDLEVFKHNFDCQAKSMERALHEKYSEYRLNGEWFDIPEDELPELLWHVESGERP